MDNDEFQQYLILGGESFYLHIGEKYGKYVEKILRYQDIDSYLILGETDEYELLDVFEKIDGSNSSAELNELKKEVCNTFNGNTSLKIGTKNKLDSLLKSAHVIVKWKKSQMMNQARLQRLDKRHSTLLTNNSDASDSEISRTKHIKLVNESISKLLTNIKYNIHGTFNTNISANDFEVIVKNLDDQSEPICTIQCVCGDRIKLYFKNNRFQLSNLQKHLNVVNKKSPSLMSSYDQAIDDQENSNQNDTDTRIPRNESIHSIIPNTSNNYTYDADSGIFDKPTSSSTIKTSQSQKQIARMELDIEKRGVISNKTTKDQSNGQSMSQVLPKQGETHSSITILHGSKLKKQLLDNETTQTAGRTVSIRTSKNMKEQDANSNNLSQSRKRKSIENDHEVEFSSTVKNNKRIPKPLISFDKIDDSDILCTLLNTIDLNSHRSPNNYRYSNAVLRFSTCLFILAGIYVYEYVRMNFKFLLPSIQTIKKFYTHNPYVEARFRYDECKAYLDSIQSRFIYVSEDCSAIIPRIEYDSNCNSFNGFGTPIVDGIPIENSFNCQTFEELKFLFENTSRANLVNIHVIQPICDDGFRAKPSASVLSAYGTDNKITSMDVLKRWLFIYQEFYCRNIRVLGFSTDGDPKYLRAMRLSSNFFVKTQTLNVCNDKLSFTINIPPNWSSWYFLNPTQLFLFAQDGIHLCTKMRNRILSKKTILRMGSYQSSIQHLHQLIRTTNKIDHNLSKSDLNVRDKQNFSSCQRISSDNVLDLLVLNDQYKATYNYLLILNLLVIAYTQPKVSLLSRIYYAWIALFYVRLWRIWLYVTKRIRESSAKASKTENKLNHFITSNALLSMEMNAHYLIYQYLLIEQKMLPRSAGDSAYLFSSQPCENIFRDARALSGIYSTRINFTVKQFLKRMDKLSALTELKQYESMNEHGRIIFPVHHKVKHHAPSTVIDVNQDDIDYDSTSVEKVIIQAYQVAQEMVTSVNMHVHLMKKNLFNMDQSSKMARKLLELNSLTESEILTIDNSIDEYDEEHNDDDEEDADQYDEYPEGDNDKEDDCFSEDDAIAVAKEVDNDDGDESEDSSDEDRSEKSIIDIDAYDSFDDDTEPTPSFENLQTTSFKGLRLLKSIPRENINSFFPVITQNRKMFLHKATATWYLQDRQSRLSSDRLRRVQSNKNFE